MGYYDRARHSACIPNIRDTPELQMRTPIHLLHVRVLGLTKVSLLPSFIVSSISHHIGDQLSGRSAKSVGGRSSLSTQTLLQKRLQTSLYFCSIFATSWLSLVPSLTSVPRALSARQNTNSSLLKVLHAHHSLSSHDWAKKFPKSSS